MYKYKLGSVDSKEEEAEVIEIYKENGEYVEKNEVVCTVEATKVTMEIEAEITGYIKFLVREGDKIEFGEVLYIINEN